MHVHAAIAVAFLGLAGIAAAALLASGPVDIRGTYDTPSHVGATVYPQTWHVTTENLTTGAFSGVDTSPVGSFTIVGKVTGNSLTVTVSGGSYVSHGTATLTVTSGTVHMVGTFVDSNGTKGTFGATFRASTGSKPAPTTTATSTTSSPAAKRPTFTAVVCTIAVTSPSSSCTAEVADAGVQRSNPPTGTARFSASSGTVGASCQLAGTPGSPGIASCTVSYVPSPSLVQGEPPPVSAGYSGDATFAASSGSSSYKPASVLGPSTLTATGGGGIPTDLVNENSFPVNADEEITVPGDIHAAMIRAGVEHAVAAPKPKLIGHASFRLRPLASIVATVKLTAAGRALLTKHKTLNGILTIATRAAGKPAKTATRRVSLRAHA